MWLSRGDCVDLTIYCRCARRYLHHAARAPNRWNEYHDEYLSQHRAHLFETLQILRRKLKLDTKTQVSVIRSSDDPMNLGSSWLLGMPERFSWFVVVPVWLVCGLYLLCWYSFKATFNSISRVHWVDQKTSLAIIAAMREFDAWISQPQSSTPHDVFWTEQALAGAGTKLKWCLRGSRIRDRGDYWPTDTCESKATEFTSPMSPSETRKWMRPLAVYTATVEGCNPVCIVCIDRFQFQIHVVDNVIEDIAFTGAGCTVALAFAVTLCGNVINKSVHEVWGAPVDQLLGSAINDLTINRKLCGMLGYKLLNALLCEVAEALPDV